MRPIHELAARLAAEYPAELLAGAEDDLRRVFEVQGVDTNDPAALEGALAIMVGVVRFHADMLVTAPRPFRKLQQPRLDSMILVAAAIAKLLAEKQPSP